MARPAQSFHAPVVQHECDQLVGKLCPMRVHDFSRFGFTGVLFGNSTPRSTIDGASPLRWNGRSL